MKNIGKKRRSEKQNGIQDKTQGNIEIKNRTVFRFRDVFAVEQRTGKTTVDQQSGECDENGESANQAVFGGRHNVHQHDTACKINELLPEFVEKTPKK